MSTYIPAALRQVVIERAGGRCEGRVTVDILQLNASDRVRERTILIAAGRYPSYRTLLQIGHPHDDCV